MAKKNVQILKNIHGWTETAKDGQKQTKRDKKEAERGQNGQMWPKFPATSSQTQSRSITPSHETPPMRAPKASHAQSWNFIGSWPAIKFEGSPFGAVLKKNFPVPYGPPCLTLTLTMTPNGNLLRAENGRSEFSAFSGGGGP